MAVNALQSKLNKALTTNAAGDYALRTQTEGAQTMSSLTMTGDIDNGGNYLLNDQTTTNMMSKGTVYRFATGNKAAVAAAGSIENVFDGGGFIQADIFIDDATSAGAIISKGAPVWMFDVLDEAGGLAKLDFFYDFDGTGNGRWETGLVLPTKTWATVTVVYDADSDANVPTLYINGIAQTITATSTVNGTRVTDASLVMTIGDDTGGAFPFIGSQHEILFGNFAPTAAEVKDLISGNIPFKWQYGSQTETQEDDMADDDTGDWTMTDATLVFDTDHYEYTYSNTTQHMYRAISLTEGKEYKCEVDVKDGTLAGVTWAFRVADDASGTNTVIYTTGLATTAAWVKHTFTFIAGAGTDTLDFIASMAGAGDFEMRNYTVNPLGAVALYTQDSITANNWFDLANGNTGAVTGASVLNPKGISTDEDNIPNFSVTSGITADTGSAQGNGVLTASINQIATCANAGDAVTLPAAKPGKVIWVFNDGANASDVFPASGDNIDEAGANAALSVAANAEVQFVCTSAGHWSTITSA